MCTTFLGGGAHFVVYAIGGAPLLNSLFYCGSHNEFCFFTNMAALKRSNFAAGFCLPRQCTPLCWSAEKWLLTPSSAHFLYYFTRGTCPAWLLLEPLFPKVKATSKYLQPGLPNRNKTDELDCDMTDSFWLLWFVYIDTFLVLLFTIALLPSIVEYL